MGKKDRKAKPPLDTAALTEADTLEIKDVRDSRCFGKSFFFMSQGLPILTNRNTLQSLDLGHVKQNNVIQNNGHSVISKSLFLWIHSYVVRVAMQI